MHSSFMRVDQTSTAAAKLHGCHQLVLDRRAWATSRWTSALAS